MSEKMHIKLSPSSAYRWLVCTPSACLEALEPQSNSSIYAEEGTEAHQLAAIRLKLKLNKINQAQFDCELNEFLSTSKFYSKEFDEFVNDYVTEVIDIITKDYDGDNVEVFIEERIDFPDVIQDGFGTADVIMLNKTKKEIHVVDLKYGKGVSVSATNNPQLRLYALGTLFKYRLYGPFLTAAMTIVQPRLSDRSTDIMSVSSLYEWAVSIKPQIKLAMLGDGPLVSGVHCKFCGLVGKCKALSDNMLEQARSQFKPSTIQSPESINLIKPNTLTENEIENILNLAPIFNDWFDAVKSYALQSMVDGTLNLPNYKLVEGRSVRQLIDHQAIIEILAKNGFKQDDYMSKPELLNLTALEKNIGKKLFNALAMPYIIKPRGKPTLALKSDPRQELLIGDEFKVME